MQEALFAKSFMHHAAAAAPLANQRAPMHAGPRYESYQPFGIATHLIAIYWTATRGIEPTVDRRRCNAA